MEETTSDDISAEPQFAQRHHTLSDQAVQVLVIGTLDTEATTADVVDGFIVDHEGAVGVLKSGVGGQDGVVWLDHGCRDLWGRIDAEFQLALLAVVHRQTLHEESAEARPGSATERVENQESLETRAIVGDTSNFVQDLVDQLLANGVVATGVVVGRILFASDHLLRVEEGAIGSGADLVDYVRLEIAVDGTRDVFPISCTVRPVSTIIRITVLVKAAYPSRRRRWKSPGQGRRLCAPR